MAAPWGIDGVINPQAFTETRGGRQQTTDGLWLHRGQLWVLGELKLNGVIQTAEYPTWEAVEALEERVAQLEARLAK
jgi:hypothetical protein